MMADVNSFLHFSGWIFSSRVMPNDLRDVTAESREVSRPSTAAACLQVKQSEVARQMMVEEVTTQCVQECTFITTGHDEL